MTQRALNPTVWQQIRNILLRAPGDGWMEWGDLLQEIKRRGIDTGAQPAAACTAAADSGWIEFKEERVPADDGSGNLWSKRWYRAVHGGGSYE
ncbi:hypothetical protein [Allopusillimonas ginsengisoli]|uniref:hypothetical protein n=1 Tax=Allopusillimonas ginsengisoli TaxID=453575 RepID=UPI001020DDA1|nr:hypothetical protein [Allopusillimonas ginsengisoli]TEA79803.1 hypothetical protein ERE07_02355 [Allopusillimonas ginsengisoli]